MVYCSTGRTSRRFGIEALYYETGRTQANGLLQR